MSCSLGPIVICGLMAVLGVAPALGQGGAAQLDDAGRRAIVEAAGKALRERYVDPDIGQQAAAAIETALAKGSYAQIADPNAFAARLTADLDAVAHDKHMRVMAADPASDAPPAGFTRPPPSESGVVRGDRLAGNVGYIQIAAFAPFDMFRQPVDRVMKDLAGSRALIIDLRANIGGDPASVKHLLSYLIAKAPLQISSTVTRTPGTKEFTTQQDWIQSLPPVSYYGKPVYVLISKWTPSAAEAIAFHVQSQHLGTLVGQTTAGAANITSNVPLAGGFQIAVPYARGQGQTWEGVGVAPDVEAPADDALKVALEQLGQSPASAGIDALSVSRVFTARTTPAPGGEAAMRRMIDEIQRGKPRYDLMSEAMANALRERLPVVREMIAGLGSIEKATFLGVDPIYGDVYNVKLAKGSILWAIALDAQGKVVMWEIRPAPQEVLK